MSAYLEAAAEQLRKIAMSIDHHTTSASETAKRERLAMHYATLAAIEKGLLPSEIAAIAAQLGQEEL